jgi:CHAT domain-containing protein/Tfp pilus assembly protein PilF
MSLRALAGIGLALVLGAPGTSVQTPQAPAPSAQERIAQLQAKTADIERTSGSNSPALASALNELAIVYFGQADYASAEPLLRRALAIRETALGPDDLMTAQVINNLAQVLQERGNYADTEPLLLRSLAIYEKVRGPDHPDVALALNNLAGLYRLMGNYRRAEPLYQRALDIREKTVGSEHPLVAVALNNFGLLYQQEGDLKKARPLLERSLAIRERTLGPDHVDVGRALNNLAVVSQEEGDLVSAEQLYLRAIANYEKAYGRIHPLVGQALNNLAVVYLLKGEYAKAGPLYEEALSIRRTTLGPRHPEMNRALTSQAIYFDVIGKRDAALELQGEATEAIDYNLTLILATGSEAQKLRYMENFTDDTDITVSMHRQSAPASAAAARLALTTLLRRKGRVLDAVSDTQQTLRNRLSADDRAVLDRLSAARGQLATMVLRGPGRQDPAAFAADSKRLEENIEQLERDVSARSAEYRSQSQPVTIEAVRAALPADSALVEIALYRPFNNRVAQRDKRFAAPRYVAYVLRKTGDPWSVELGEAELVDRRVDVLRRALRNPASANTRTAARALYQRVLTPLAPGIEGTRRLLISPDGALNLVPFAALLDANGRYAIETYEISYLTSGRDLLRFQVQASESARPLVVANPQFGNTPVDGSAAPSARGVDLSRARFKPLAGTAAEANALRNLLPGAEVLTGGDATESAVKSAHGPRVLHLATHGFFLGSDQRGSASSGRYLVQTAATDAAPAASIENPLLRSGLAFAGANQRDGGHGDDGILTALEASSLDLWGTRMAVLSACETGLGETRRGDGVYGLRRALVMAGAESQVMSLWQVSDEGTRALMTAFYTRLKAGEPRSAALRRVQLEMLRSPTRKHPYYWASFILSGADGPIPLQ